LSEIENLSIVQYKRYTDAICRREINKFVLYAKIIRSSFASKEEFENFIENLMGNRKREKYLTENELRNMGFSKRG